MQEKSISSIQEKEILLECVQETDDFTEKFSLLKQAEIVPEHFLLSIGSLPIPSQYILSVLFLLDQEHVLAGWENAAIEQLESLAHTLLALDKAFSVEGGIIGYHKIITELLSMENEEEKIVDLPNPIPLQEETDDVRKYIFHALENLEKMCELYPVGGAAERLNLSDPTTNKRIPAAKLPFLNKSLLEGIVDDVKAREYLAYKLFGKQVRTPIGLMTSKEKNNHNYILDLCRSSSWFHRGEESFFFFSQPLVPCITKEGKWIASDPLTLELKPGGHGMIWLLAQENGVFRFFEDHNRTKILLRQINNPIAGVDFGLLGFIGYGLSHDKGFGFASCERRQGAKEGMNVIVRNERGSFLTNLEYCDFEKYGVDLPSKGYAHYPANTNLLFADRTLIQKALEIYPLPGKILNFSDKGNGSVSARLETMMQNIADVIPCSESYLTLGERRKTIASAKKAYVEGGGIFETPLGALYTHLCNAHELLTIYCGFSLPPHPDPEIFEREGPSFLFTYHPGLGPLYSIIGQKLRGGALSKGAALKLDIADISIKNLTVDGALAITAENLLGHEENGILQYSENTGKCTLENVSVATEVTITLQGNSGFIARDVSFQEPLSITVPNGMTAIAFQNDWGMSIRYEPKSSMFGAAYTFDDSYQIKISFEEMMHEM